MIENTNQFCPPETVSTNLLPATSDEIIKKTPIVTPMAVGVSRKNIRLLGTLTCSVQCSLLPNSKFVDTVSGGQNWLVFSIMQSLIFAGGVYIVLQGVSMLIGEIIPAFKGISDKLVPGAKPAIDCPMVFSFYPNAVIIGFLSSFSIGLVVMVIQYAFGWTIIVPGVVPHFFVGAAAGCYGAATGGLRGSVLGLFSTIKISFALIKSFIM
jgi:ascorbate-specific PTS system EIIC-type component UlaA